MDGSNVATLLTPRHLGYLDGRDGYGTDSNPYTVGTVEYDQWFKGWHDRERENAQRMN